MSFDARQGSLLDSCVRRAALQLKAGEIPAIRFKQSTRLPTL
ncbi:hypothetical protein ALTERO38_60416 [Alteromonas sp. 38]|nr:hypothetical protein ALTER154_40378 [Alteromonas sp. 154]VXC20840.1 hypothetical protein ALTERO38_60416 [Alteromonas sp. 38]